MASPVLAHEAHVKFTPLQVFPGVTHDLIKGVFQEVVPAYDEPGTHTHTHDFLDFSTFLALVSSKQPSVCVYANEGPLGAVAW